MKKLHEYRWWLRDQAGAVVILVALLLTFLIGVVAFALNIGYRHVTQNELQNIADGAALAATRHLGSLYQNMTYAEQQAYDAEDSGDESDIIGVAKDLGKKNKAARKSITIDSSDIAIGTWYSNTFTQNYIHPNAVRVTARRDAVSEEGPITTFFASFIGAETMSVRATATAALTGECNSEEGELVIPVGVSDCNFKNPDPDDPEKFVCGTEVVFSPTGVSCAGWTTFDLAPNHNPTPVLMLEIVNGEQDSNAYVAHENMFDFTGGDLGANINNLILLFRDEGYDITEDDQYICEDGAGYKKCGDIDEVAPVDICNNDDG
jgi:Flp pilus assembly protein TadG